MDAKKLKNILEAGLLVAGRTLTVAQLEALFQHDSEQPSRKDIKAALEDLGKEYEGRGIELVEVASGYRLQSHSSVSDWVANLFQEKTPRYSRALLETLVLIAYRQPITRAEIEDVRGVAVSSNIIKTLQEREWVKVLGHKDVPGRPALLGTTKEFLDYFNLKKLDDLPALADIKDLDQFDDLLAEEAGEETGEENVDDQSGGEAAVSGDGESSIIDLGVSSNAGSDDSSGAMLDIGAENAGDSSEDEEQAGGDGEDPDQNVNNNDSGEESGGEQASLADDSETLPDDESIDHDSIDPNETLSGPELELLQKISDFSDEAQLEIDARNEQESRILSRDSIDEEESDEDEVADLSQRVQDDHSGDMPDAGDTLH